MKKADFITNFSKKVDITKTDAALAVEGLFELIAETMQAGETIEIVGFGKFETFKTKERNGFNPVKKEKTVYPPKTKVRFKPSATFTKSLNA